MHPFIYSIGPAVGSTGAVDIACPVHRANDILLAYFESDNQEIATEDNWGIVPDAPQGTGTPADLTATRLSVFWRRAADGATPNFGVADPGDHHCGFIIAVRGCITSGNPWDVTAGDVEATGSTSGVIPGDTTTVDECLVIAAISNATDGGATQHTVPANADLEGVVMWDFARVNGTIGPIQISQGNGGGLALICGVKLVAGAFGTTTVTLATSSKQGRHVMALKPASAPGGNRRARLPRGLSRMG